MTKDDTGVETTLLGQRVRLHDLSQEVSQQTQMHPLHPRVEVYPFESHANSLASLGTGFSYRSSLVIASDHASTHVDALCHFDPAPDAPTIDVMPLDLFCGDAICLDLSHLPARHGITVADVEQSLARDGLDLRRGDIVLLYTGHYERTGGTPEYLTEFPGLEPETARWLIEQGAKMFGNQAMSVDVPERYHFPVHGVCRELGVTHIENVGALAPVAGKRFTLFGFPLKIVPGTGSPIRLVAAVPA
ncbi:MAG: cyclase family protein [Thermoleophilia bacterium]